MEQARFGEVLRNREARVLLLSAAISDIGDQVARVALSVLVFHRTGSVLLTAAVYAVSYLPWLLGGPLLAGLADRLPVRRVLVGADLARAVAIGLMLVPGVPVGGLLLLLFLAELAAPPFQAGRATLMPEVLKDDAYVAGSALLNAVTQAALVGGVAIGGLLLVLMPPAAALALDAASFAVSALLLQRGLADRPASGGGERPALLADARDGLRAVFGDASVRRLVVAVWVACAVSVVPEGLALAYARSLGEADWTVSVLLAAEPVGATLTTLAVARLVPPSARLRLLWAVLGVPCLLLVGMLARPGLLGTSALLLFTGMSAAGVLVASTTLGRTVAPAVRSRVFGVAASGLMVGQGSALFLGGALASVLAPHQVMALAGAVGAAVVALLAAADVRARRATPSAAARAPVSPAAACG